MRWQDHIVASPDTLHGAPRFKGTPIPVSLVLEDLAEGTSIDEIRQDYPSLRPEAVAAALAYAAALASEPGRE
jgi:uncharacterized protein (DUF433 family)